MVAAPSDGDDVAYLDNPLQGTVVERPADVPSLRQSWESVGAEAMSHGQTLRMISEAAEAWT
ncbi:Scr1 family TA system antitoxin-like transcriptional regulator [Micromonospora sp. NPDC049274]|uniref:Scr1 family TA system antitoxin-like transcriptional regulator n=1 Tax=Micromonospora sp. NPDC049274 TaxID=3154829 RepID=UPI00344875C0